MLPAKIVIVEDVGGRLANVLRAITEISVMPDELRNCARQILDNCLRRIDGDSEIYFDGSIYTHIGDSSILIISPSIQHDFDEIERGLKEIERDLAICFLDLKLGKPSLNHEATQRLDRPLKDSPVELRAGILIGELFGRTNGRLIVEMSTAGQQWSYCTPDARHYVAGLGLPDMIDGARGMVQKAVDKYSLFYGSLHLIRELDESLKIFYRGFVEDWDDGIEEQGPFEHDRLQQPRHIRELSQFLECNESVLKRDGCNPAKGLFWINPLGPCISFRSTSEGALACAVRKLRISEPAPSSDMFEKIPPSFTIAGLDSASEKLWRLPLNPGISFLMALRNFIYCCDELNGGQGPPPIPVFGSEIVKRPGKGRQEEWFVGKIELRFELKDKLANLVRKYELRSEGSINDNEGTCVKALCDLVKPRISWHEHAPEQVKRKLNVFGDGVDARISLRHSEGCLNLSWEVRQ